MSDINPDDRDGLSLPDSIREMLRKVFGLTEEQMEEREAEAKNVLFGDVANEPEYEHCDYLNEEEIKLFNEMKDAADAVQKAIKIARGKKRIFWAYLEDKRGLQEQDLRLDVDMQSILKRKTDTDL